jgi:hypothetical protein
MAADTAVAVQVSTPAPLRRFSWPQPKALLFVFIALMYAYVLWHNESFLFNSKDPEWAHIGSFKWFLLPHGLAAACALFLGPLQFSDRLRKRFAKVHRVMGRFYVAGVLVGAPLGIYIQHFEEHMGRSRSFTLAAAADAAVWIFCTLVALTFILKRNVPAPSSFSKYAWCRASSIWMNGLRRSSSGVVSSRLFRWRTLFCKRRNSSAHTRPPLSFADPRRRPFEREPKALTAAGSATGAPSTKLTMELPKRTTPARPVMCRRLK